MIPTSAANRSPSPPRTDPEAPLPPGEGCGVRASEILSALRAFARETRAAAGLELVIGVTVAMLPVAYLCFDLYKRVAADTAGARIAATMADYVSRGPDTDGGTLDGNAMKSLGKFLLKRELDAPADLVYVVTAIHQPAGVPAPAVEVLWSDDANLRFGDATATATLAGDCSRYVGENGGQTTLDLPDDFTMVAGEVAIIVEVCASLTREGALSGLVIGDIYRLHALPARSSERDWVPARPPVFAALDGRGNGPAAAAPAPTLLADSGLARAAQARATA